MNRREFTKNVARYGIVSAVAVVLGIKKAEASNYCWTEDQPVSTCQSRHRTCCNLTGCTAWSYYSHNNCLYFGKNQYCCG